MKQILISILLTTVIIVGGGIGIFLNFRNDINDKVNTELINRMTDFIQKNGDTLKGDNGLNGIDGINGADGINGQNGLDGVNGINGQNGLNGIDGQNGLSAYEIAVVNGFVGTQAEWLASLHGQDGLNGQDGIGGDVDNLISISTVSGNTGFTLVRNHLYRIMIINTYNGTLTNPPFAIYNSSGVNSVSGELADFMVGMIESIGLVLIREANVGKYGSFAEGYSIRWGDYFALVIEYELDI